MAGMNTYTIKVIYFDKRVHHIGNGPYFGGYLDIKEAERVAKEYESRPEVFMAEVVASYVMG